MVIVAAMQNESWRESNTNSVEPIYNYYSFTNEKSVLGGYHRIYVQLRSPFAKHLLLDACVARMLRWQIRLPPNLPCRHV
ncbi:MAG TPA: hypothetical protein DDW52_18585 [Planctomycetaceae bacterium]|nr:hypothetical protein [Planctomycetaceae bacterium]